MSALYIGAGCDIDPITKCPNIKIFNYVDCQPKSEFGVNYDPGFARPNFLPNLHKAMTEIGMKLINTIENIIIYSNGDQTVNYYTNTSIPEHNDKIKSLEYDTLIVAGHHPHYSFLNDNDHKLKFIGFEGTVYSKEEQETLLSRSYVTNKILVQDMEDIDRILVNRMITSCLSEYKKPFYKITDNSNISESTSLNGKKVNDDELKKALNDNTAIFEVTTESKKMVYFHNRDLIESSETENINWKLHYNEDIQNRFSSFEYIPRENPCTDDRKTFTSWQDFVKHSEDTYKKNLKNKIFYYL